MRIAIDARWIFPEISGIGAYTRDLIRHLTSADTPNRYVLLFDNPEVRERTISETDTAQRPNVETVLLPYGVFSLRNQFYLRHELRRRKIDVYHSTNYMIPFAAFPANRAGAVRCVTTIHDVIPMIFPNHAPRSRKARVYPLYRRLMLEVGRRSDAIVTDSEASRKDIIEHLRIPAERQDRVRVVYCGVNPRFRPPQQPLSANPNRTRNILYVGRCDPYKNIDTLLKAFAAACQRTELKLRLTLAGSPDPRYPEPQQLADRLGIRDAVTWTGYVSDEMLVRLYQESDLLVHPSRYEGFGLQVAEAMACGTPVICSNAGSIPEVAGDATVLLDPDDVAGFAAAIARVLSTPSETGELVDRGLSRVAQFTWERAAAGMSEIYSELGPHA